MESKLQLPDNGKKYFEIRLESIGGLGANLCGKLLGELGAVTLGLNAASFSSYGSEKQGSPVKAFIRWCNANEEIQVNSPVEQPDILGVFHVNMAGKAGVNAGIRPHTHIIINTDHSPEQMRERFRFHAGQITCIDALKIALEEKTRINMVMLGAIAKAAGFVEEGAVQDIVRETLGQKYPAVIENNARGIYRGFREGHTKSFTDDGKYPYVSYQEPQSKWGYDNAPIGGVNIEFGSTVSNDLSASREDRIPLFHKERCINCGLCDTTCPDMVFQFAEHNGKVENMGLDYHHCKGCLRCVAVCPVQALTAARERDTEKNHVMRNQQLLVERLEYEDTGANSIVTSESYMDEERV